MSSFPKFTSTLVNIGLAIATIFFALVVLEGAFRLHEWLSPPSMQPRQLRWSRPAPYVDSPFYTNKFLFEQEVAAGTFYTPTGTDLILIKDFAGEYISQANGQRTTTDQPTEFTK